MGRFFKLDQTFENLLKLLELIWKWQFKLSFKMVIFFYWGRIKFESKYEIKTYK